MLNCHHLTATIEQDNQLTAEIAQGMVVLPVIKPLAVEPSVESQVIQAPAGTNGFNPVRVSGVDSSIDSNIQPENIKDGVNILGVEGTFDGVDGEVREEELTSVNGETFVPSVGKNAITSITVTPHNENRTINPSTSEQVIGVNNGYSGNGIITVNAVTADIDSDIQAENIKTGVNILGVVGNYDGLDGETVVINPSTSQQIITPTAPHNAITEVTVNAVTSAIDSDIQSGNIKSGVNILGVEGNVVELNGEDRTVELTNESSDTFYPERGYNAILSITVSPKNKSQNITPTTSQQTINVPNNYSGNGTITVDAVTSSIDSNIQPENIKSGVSILGVNGNVVELNGETINVIPSTSSQTILPTNPYNAITQANVNAVDSSIDVNIIAGNIKDGVSILGVTGNVIELNGSTETVIPTTQQQTITPTSPSNGFTSVTIDAVTSAIDSNITSNNIKSGVSILGVSGSVVELNGTTTTINPATTSQTVMPTSPNNGFTEVTVPAVTSSIDANIVAGNIKNGVTILGVTGDYAGIIPSGTRTITQNGIYDVSSYANADVQVSGAGPAHFIQRNVDANGKLVITGSVPVIDMNGVTDIGGYALYYAYYYNTGLTGTVDFSNLTSISGNNACASTFYNCTGITGIDLSGLATLSGAYACQYMFANCYYITSIDLSSLTTISGSNACPYMFSYCTRITSINLSSLTTISGESACNSMFNNCTGIISVDLSSLTTISGRNACQYMFPSCSGIISVDLSSLTTINGSNACQYMFQSCGGITSIDLSSLTTISGSRACNGMFAYCSSLATVYIGGTTAIDFGTDTNQFGSMFAGCTQNIDVYAPAANQTQIEAFSGYPSFGCSGTVTWHWRS